MSLAQPLAAGRGKKQSDTPCGPLEQHGVCSSYAAGTIRVIVLIDVSQLATPSSRKGANNEQAQHNDDNTAPLLDSLRLSVLRVLSQLSISCAQDSSYIEWAARFFDSRQGGVGKTPAELKARLRSRQGGSTAGAARGGFKRLTQTSFREFGDACLAVACSIQGDPLARDRAVALRRWSHGRKKQQISGTNWEQAAAAREGSSAARAAAPSVEFAPRLGGGKEATRALAEEEDGNGPSRMYNGHDMSSHEVVARSLREVLQEFGEIGCKDDQAVRSSLPSSGNGDNQQGKQRLLLVLHSACPQSDDEVDRFALQGNFTTQAPTIAALPPEDKAASLLELLNAGLGKAILRGHARGVSILWQSGPSERGIVAKAAAAHRDGSSSSSTRNIGATSLTRCLSAAGGASTLRWGQAVESTGLLPPSVTLGRVFSRQLGVIGADSGLGLGMDRCTGWGGSEEGGMDRFSQNNRGAKVAVALGTRGVINAHLLVCRLSGDGERGGTRLPACKGEVAGCEPSMEAQTAAQSTSNNTSNSNRTPWRLIGTVTMSEVWPGCLKDQGWGAAVVLRAAVGDGDGDGVRVWRELLAYLLAEGLAVSMTLPRRIFYIGDDGGPNNSKVGVGPREEEVSGALVVALLTPISLECAVGWIMTGLDAAVLGGGTLGVATGGEEAKLGPPGLQSLELQRSPLSTGVSNGAQKMQGTEQQSTVAASRPPLPSAGSLAKGSTAETETTLRMRRVEVAQALQEASLFRKRRRQEKGVLPGGRATGRARGMSEGMNCAIAAASAERAAAGGGGGGDIGGSFRGLSPRDSAFRIYTGDDMSGGGGGGGSRTSLLPRWKLETASETSHVSGSPRSFRLLEAAAAETDPTRAWTGGRGNDDDGDERASTSSSSGPRRALHQALEDISSRSSLLGADAECSSTPGSREGSGSSVSGSILNHHQRLESCGRGSRSNNIEMRRGGGRRRGRGGLFPTNTGEEEEEDEVGTRRPSEPIVGGASELPLSFMSEPTLACLPGAPLPTELVVLAERCVCGNSNNNPASAAANSTSASGSAGTDVGASTAGRHNNSSTCEQTPPGLTVVPQPLEHGDTQAVRRVGGARRRFVAAVRAAEERINRDNLALPEQQLSSSTKARGDVESTLALPFLQRRDAPGNVTAVVGGKTTVTEAVETGLKKTTAEECLGVNAHDDGCRDGVAVAPAAGGEEGISRSPVVGGEAAATDFGDRVREGVAGLRRQYLEVVEGGQRSPVEFVVRTVPEAIRDLAADACMNGGNYADISNSKSSSCIAINRPEENRHAAATALALAAVVSGLTSSPEELSAKHKANRSARAAAASAAGQTAGSSAETSAGQRSGEGGAVATLAMQKVRDYQLQALLMCQLNTLAMDLPPEPPESIAAFAALTTTTECSSKDKKDKRKSSGKGKGRKRKRKSGSSGGGKDDDDSAPVRPSDPLPGARRARLESFLQPISTMLDACTVTRTVRPPLAPPTATSNVEGGSGNASASGVTGTGGAGGGGGGGGADSFHPRAYDGTLADFMGLALVEHFALRLPRTLTALFDDFERHPPDTLTAALAAAENSASNGGGGGDESAAGGVDAGAGGSGAEVEAKTKTRAEGEGEVGVEAHKKAKNAMDIGEGASVAEPPLLPDFPGGGETSSSRVSATAGILLSDRTSMSHNHFKMSGVLNGFREVKLKAHSSSRKPRSGPLMQGSNVEKAVRGVGGGSKASRVSEHKGAWRTSSAGGAGGRGSGGSSRARSTRDAKQSAVLGKSASTSAATAKVRTPATRQSPRLVRKRPSDGGGGGDAIATAGTAAAITSNTSATNDARSKRKPSSSTFAQSAETSQPGGKRRPSSSSRSKCGGGGDDGDIPPRIPYSGVLVGETPQKQRRTGVSAVADAASTTMRATNAERTNRRLAGAGTNADYGKHANDAADGDNIDLRKASGGVPVTGRKRAAVVSEGVGLLPAQKPVVEEGGFPPSSPSAGGRGIVMASPASTGRTMRQRAMANNNDTTDTFSPCIRDSASGAAASRTTGAPSPPSWRAVSSTASRSRLFVAESPSGCVDGGAAGGGYGVGASGRRGGMGAGGGWSMAESLSVSGGVNNGIARQLVTENVIDSPLPRRRQPVVPDTPA